MYKGLLQHPTFIYTECSDITEVFVPESESCIKQFGKTTAQKKSRKKTESVNSVASDSDYETNTLGKQRQPNLSSSATSIINRPSSTLVQYSTSGSSHAGRNDSESNIFPKSHVTFVTKHTSVNSINLYKGYSHCKEYLQRDSITTESQKPADMSLLDGKQDFTNRKVFQFSKDFAICQHFRRKPTDNLLNPFQYDTYLREVSSRDKLHGSTCLLSDSENPFHPPSLSSTNEFSSLEPNADNVQEVKGHVVGDLLCFTSNTSRYFDNPDLSDITLVVGEHRFYAHKFALAAQSDVLRDILIARETGSSCSDCPRQELELKESEECQNVFKHFLSFFYRGKTSFTLETALPLLVLSAKYEVEALRVACNAFITRMIENGDLNSTIQWLRYATSYQLQDLISRCVDGAISDNIEELVESPGWLKLPVSCVEAILDSSSLLIPHEFYLFECLQRWLMAQLNIREEVVVTEYLKRTIQYIRFSQMHGTQLLAVEESPLGVRYRSTIKMALGEAYRYQILSKDCSEFQESQHLSRDYTDRKWCVHFFYYPNRNKRGVLPTFYGNGRWEIQPKRYYDTLNIVVVLKKPLETDMKVYISILIFKKGGSVLMRLRRKACILRAVNSPPNFSSLERLTPIVASANTSPRSTSLSSNVVAANAAKDNSLGTQSSVNHLNQHHRSPHGPLSKLHGPHNGQEYYAIDNILTDADFQTAMDHLTATGLKLGAIIRTCSADAL